MSNALGIGVIARLLSMAAAFRLMKHKALIALPQPFRAGVGYGIDYSSEMSKGPADIPVASTYSRHRDTVLRLSYFPALH
ncbi:hypothetical protein DFH28DRAFT_1120348 [Melampsora americana]|nr:hypothetical protein DFH28DRAFT_1120348 [Melampsora americana]